MKLIIDESTIELISKKLPGQPIYSGSNGNLLEPGIIDIYGEEEVSDKWQPGNNHTKQLVLGVEACQDVLFYLNQFLEQKTQKRAMKRMTVPICSLIDIIIKLHNITNNRQFRNIQDSSWPNSDINTYKKLTKRLKQINFRTPIRRVRNKLAAHLDSNIFIEKMPILKHDDILEPLGDCIILLMLSSNYPSENFQWIRFLGISEDKKYLSVETMYSYPVCVRWLTDIKGHVKDIGTITLAVDPRHELREHMLLAVSSYNKMINTVNSKLSPINIIPTDELLQNIDK